MLDISEKCPKCGLVLLHGAIFDAVEKAEKYGPILGINRNADPNTAAAGYVGLGSFFDPTGLRATYRCPRCGSDTIVQRQAPP